MRDQESEIQTTEHPQEKVRRLRTEAFSRLIDIWSRLSPELQRRRIGWLVGQLEIESAEQLIRYAAAAEKKL
ncbi:MAG: hypothetical protein J0M26_05905 [Planctomycetes bacterium]|nr:hypothetical protein [Planctomycetota bacterium]